MVGIHAAMSPDGCSHHMNGKPLANFASDRRTALVTGGSRGIGAAVVRAFAELGMNVGCGYRTGREQAEELARENGAQVIPLYYDLCNADSAVGALNAVADSWGRLDSLVVNASIWKGGKLGQIPPDD